MAEHSAERDEQYRFGGQRGTSRRTVLKIIGGGGAAAWAIGTYAAASSATPAAPVAADSVEASVAKYFQSRVDAANSRQPKPLVAKIDPANRELVTNETERAAYLADLGGASRWNGRIQGFSTSTGIISVKTDGSSSTVRVYEELGIAWSPKPVQRSREALQAAKRDPERYDLGRREGEAVSSAVGIAHELKLEKASSGWVVASDAYIEDLFLGNSPDAETSAWAVSMDTARPNGSLRTEGQLPPEAPAVTAAAVEAAAASGVYSWQKAVEYANKYWSSYNSAYPNYNPCGGDCANFVSQCLRAGGETSDGTWRTYSGVGCGRSSTNCGSTAWVNNWGLRNWTINAKRGRSVSSISGLGRGDIVNYDWTGNGVFDHVAIITNSASMLVTAHNSNRHNVPWSMGAKKHKFTWILGHF